jgi:hypothetical protein
MPSAEHESPIALAKLDPGVLTWLLANLFGVKVPDYHHARSQATDVRVMVPRTYHADSVLVFCDPTDRPLLAVILEVQRHRFQGKRRTWKLYVADIEAELNVNVALLVYCPEPAVARWYRRMLDTEELSLILQPFIFTPSQIPMLFDEDVARARPALAVLSAICNGGHAEVDAMFPALTEALRSLGPDKAILYYDIVLVGLPVEARTRWEAFMTATIGHEFRSALLRNVAAQHAELGEARGEARGVARGEARAVLTVLEARGVEVSDTVREEILACSDLTQLDNWLRRALTASSCEDVVHY